MIKISPFSAALHESLHSLGFECAWTTATDAAPEMLCISRTGSSMHIIPLSLEDWRMADQPRLLARLLQTLSQMRSQGLIAVALWEDYWLSRKNIVVSRLKAQLGNSVKIPARLTEVRRIDKVTTMQFLDAHHLNGAVSSKFRYGLFLPSRYYRILPADFPYKNSDDALLVAVATFSNARLFEQNDLPFRSHELIRFASLCGTNVAGGFNKLVTAFIRDKAPDDIMTYADIEWSDGRSYRKLGFEERGTIPPRAVYLDLMNFTRSTRRTEQQAASTDGPRAYLTVFHLGSIKYVKVV